jgi:hypothetical protein
MIKEIINILQVDNFYGKSEIIELAKGGFKYPETFKEFVKVINRKIRMNLKGK